MNSRLTFKIGSMYMSPFSGAIFLVIDIENNYYESDNIIRMYVLFNDYEKPMWYNFFSVTDQYTKII